MYKEKIKRFLFHEPDSSAGKSIILLVARLIFGFLFLNHGIAKWNAFVGFAETFPDPIGIGSTLSLWLVLFAEIFCSIGFMLGALFRLSLIPMIFTMCVALFVIHAGDPLDVKELSLMYLAIFALLFITGPGRFSIDGILKRIFLNS